MFNFYVDWVGHDMVIDTGKTTKCRCKCKAPSLQTKSTKKAPFENLGLNAKQFEDSDEKKKQKHTSSFDQKTP